MKVEIQATEMFRFNSKQEWINKARSWFKNCGVRQGNYICIDAVGRVCTCGAQFSRAEREETYPIIAYVMEGLQ